MKDARYTVHQLAALSGVSVRTLHHYDEIGLLPALRSGNNYRRYGSDQVNRLQQILLYRETGMPLSDIARLLDDPNYDAPHALQAHLKRLQAQRERVDDLIATVEKTIAIYEGGNTMSDEEKFEAFKQRSIEKNEEEYGSEVRERWGDETADASAKKFAGMTKEGWKDVQDIEAQMKEALLAGMASGDAAGPDAQRAADLHRQWLCRFWPDGMYTADAHRGMAEMYVADERFKAYYEAFGEGAAAFLRDAIIAYCA